MLILCFFYAHWRYNNVHSERLGSTVGYGAVPAEYAYPEEDKLKLEDKKGMWHHLPKLTIDTEPLYEIIGRDREKDNPNDYGLYSISLPDDYMRYLKNLFYVKIDYAYIGKFYANSWPPNLCY